MEFHIRKAMKHILVLTFLRALMLAPPALFAQAKPEVANASTAAKRASESAPAQKEALWQQQREALMRPRDNHARAAQTP